jgi:glucosamine-6-phosphate deaminase
VRSRGLRFVILPDAAAVEEHVVGALVTLAGERWLARTALASGSTFAGVFRRLRKLVDGGFSGFQGVTFHHLDEFEGVEPSSRGALSTEIASALFPDDDERRGWFFPVDATSDDEAVLSHERNLAGCSLVLLGIGTNGHIAFNEPGTPFSAKSHFATLAPETRAAHASRFAGDVPGRALTAGIATILSAQSIMLVATGKAKAPAIARAFGGAASHACPASALTLHDRVTVVLDEDAASELDSPGTAIGIPMTLIGRGSADAPGPTLVVAPHPDDASISCGGLLSIASDRSKKHVLTFSTGARGIPGVSPGEAQKIRERESAEEARILGASVSFLRAKAYETGVFEPADSAALAAILADVRPARVLAPSPDDPHPTHRLCRLTVDDAIRAWRRADSRVFELWTYEGPWCLLDQEDVNVLVVLDAAARERKQSGIRAHESQMSRVPFHEGAAALERLRAITFSESQLGGRSARGFDHEARVECFSRFAFGPSPESLAQYSSSR